MVRTLIRLIVIAAATIALWSPPAAFSQVPCEYRFPCWGGCGEGRPMWMRWRCWDANTGRITSQGIMNMDICCY